MNYSHSSVRSDLSPLSMFCVMSFALGVSACANAQLANPARWQEEALQHDGSKIIVERTVERGGRHEPNQQPDKTRQSLAFTVPGTGQQFVWEDNAGQDIRSANFNVLAIGVIAGEAYVLATPAGCLSWNKWGRPNPPYVAFRHESTSWLRIPIEEVPSVIERPNLIASSPDDEARRVADKTGRNLITSDFVTQHVRGYRQPELRRILREPLQKPVKEGCPDMVGNGNGRWQALDLFTQERSYDACVAYCVRVQFGPEFCPCAELLKAK